MTRSISSFSMAYSVLAGPILWFVQFVALYIVAEFGCRANFMNMTFVTPETIRLLTTIITIVLLIAVAVGALLAYRTLRGLPANSDDSSPLHARIHFLGMAGIYLSILFVFVIIVTAIPAYFVVICDQAT